MLTVLSAEGVRNRQTKLAARRLASAQKRALFDAARSGRIGESGDATLYPGTDV